MFDQSQSSSLQLMANAATAGADTSENVTTTSPIWAQDTITLVSNVSVQHYPLNLLSAAYNGGAAGSRAALGLSSNSTILSTLKNAGTIGSRSYGFWFGLAGATPAAQMDGSLVLGGYDAAKITRDQNFTGSIADPLICPSGLSVTIESIVLNFPNGSNPNLLDPLYGSSPLQACVSTEAPVLMSIPLNPYFNRFEAFTDTQSIDRSVGINFFTMLFPPDNVYEGDITFTLDSGFSVRVPNSQLVLPNEQIANNGTVVYDNSVSDLMLYSLQDVNANDIPRIGWYFFTSAYLYVNHDDNTFTLWQANPTTDTNLVSVVSADNANACSNGSTPTIPLSSIPTTSNTNSTSQPATQTSISGAAIGGIAAGGVVAIAAIGLIIFCFIRKRKAKQAAKMPRDTYPGNNDPQPWSGKSELPAGSNTDYKRQSRPAEMWDQSLRSPRELWAGQQDSRTASRAYELS